MMNTNNDKEMPANEHVSKAQTEVWEWKQKAFEELQNVPAEKRMEHIRHNTQPYIEAILKAKKNKTIINQKRD